MLMYRNKNTKRLTKYLENTRKILQHKWYVLETGLKLRRLVGAKASITQLIVHDWHKFTPMEFFAYTNYFLVDKTSISYKTEFVYAWLEHSRRGKHHWEYWLLNPTYNLATSSNGRIPIPTKYLWEMVIDWIAASKSYTNSYNIYGWVQTNRTTLQNYIHPGSWSELENILKSLERYGYYNDPKEYKE